MEVNKDYKQTKIGKLPNDWECVKLGDFCEFTQGVQIPQSEQIRSQRDGYIRYLYIRDFFTDDFQWFVKNVYHSKIINVQDIMMVNTGNTAGSVYSGKHGVLSNNAFKITFDDKLVNRDYLFVLLRSHIVQRTIQSIFNAAGQPHVGHNNIARVYVPIPPKTEQTAIATALSDSDALIQSLEELIAKKRLIKQGAIQELLKPKEGWVEKKLGECLQRNPEYGLNAPSVEYSDSLPLYLRITDISNDGNFIKDNMVSVNHPNYIHYFLEEGDLVFARTGASVGKTYLYKKNDGNLVFAGFLIRVKPNTKIMDPIYLKYFTHTKTYWDWVKANSMRSGQPGINGFEYSLLPIPLPPNRSDQNEIIEILNDMDTEITELETKLSKYKQLKHGMMQNLLTGKIRLV